MFQFLRHAISQFLNRKFVHNVAVLQIGTFSSILIQAVAGILIARFLQPEQFGLYTLAFSLASVTSIFLGTGIQDAVTPPLSRAWTRNDKDEFQQVFGFWIRMILMTAIFTLVISLLLPWAAGKLYDNLSIGFLAIVVVAASVISTLFYSFSYVVLQMSGRIKGLMLFALSDVATRYALSIGFVLAGFGLLGAVSGHFFGALLVAVLAVVIWRHIQRQHHLLPSLAHLLVLGRTAKLRPLIGPSFWVTVDRNIGMLYMSLPVVLVGAFVTTSEVTYFKLAFGYINLALGLLGPISVLLNVEFPKMQVDNAGKLSSYFVRISLYAMGISAILTIGAVIVAPVFFRVVYGSSFMPSVPYIMGLLLYGAFFGIGVGLGPMWRALNKVKTSILINMITLGIGIPLGIVLIKEFHIWGAVAMVTLWYTVSHVASFLYLSRKLRTLEPSGATM